MRGVERIAACSHEAAALGVVCGQPTAEVTGLNIPGMAVFAHDAEADREALAQWAERCERFSPLVGVDDAPEPDSLLLDVTGTARLFHGKAAQGERSPAHRSWFRDGEAALVEEAVDLFARRRLRVRAAVADTPAGACAVAHFHAAFLVQRSPVLLIPPGETPAALRRLPIESLRLPERTTNLLHELGIDLLGQLAALRREELSSRFGPELLRRWDRATGVRPEPIGAVRPRPEFAAAWEPEPPARRRETIEAALEGVLARLAGDLLAAGRGAIRIECRFDCLPDDRRGDRAGVRLGGNGSAPEPQAETSAGLSFRRFTLGLFRPTVDVRHLLGLLQLKLEQEPLAGPVAGMEVSALETGPLVQRQMALFAGVPGGRHDPPGGDAVAELLERLSSRLGRQTVVSVVLLPDAQPERAWRGEPLIGGPRRKRAGKARAVELPPRPLLVFPRPVALRAMPAVHVHGGGSTSSGEPPARPLGCVHFDGEEHRVVGSWGPERIETGWWRGRPIARDYYHVETAAGRRLWLFGRLDTGRWFAHGTFD